MRLYALDDSKSEVIFAPFHDPVLSEGLPFKLNVQNAINCRAQHHWDATHIYWSSCAVGQLACSLELDVDLAGLSYDRFLFCVTFGESIRLNFEALLDGQWQNIVSTVGGSSSRQEITAPVPLGQITKVRMNCLSVDGQRAVVRMHWFGLSDMELVAQCTKYRHWIDTEWAGLITDESQWGNRQFYRGLLFDAYDLEVLRSKKNRPYWKEHFAVLEQRAASYLERSPENDLGLYLPWLDERYVRARERGRTAYFWEPLTLAVVGLVNGDAQMIRHAARYLMCLVHTVHWCQSAESRANGSTWNQRCFMEEMACTSVALLTDWLDFALTEPARALIHQALWEKGLAAVERDMMSCEEVHRINQGVWFCRCRILAGLILEKSWPHVGNYVDRACEDLRNTLDRYVKSDGGVEEGMGYFCLTLSFALQGLTAYSRARCIDLQTLLPPHIRCCEQFLSTMSAVEPGRLLMDGDNSTDRMAFDAIAILAGLFSDSVYSQVLAATLLPDERPFTYFDHYDAGGIFGFLLGPLDVLSAHPIVPEFSNLPDVGQLTNFRQSEERSLRIHLSGASAYPSHAHFDRGAFTLEADGVRVFIDRGIVRYDHPACFTLKRTCLHNTLTPMLEDDSFPDQAACEQATLPSGHGDHKELLASISLSQVWRDYMRECHRTIRSHSCDEATIVDEGELSHPGRVAFHLHSPWQFKTCDNDVHLVHKDIHFVINADWCVQIRHAEDSIDYRMQPVFHLVLISHKLTQFSFETHIKRV